MAFWAYNFVANIDISISSVQNVRNWANCSSHNNISTHGFLSINNISAHAYTSSVFVYACSLCFATAAAFHIKKETWLGYGLGIIFMLLSLFCYQAFVPFTSCLMVLVILKRLLSENDFSFKIWWTVIKMIIVFSCAILVYYYVTVLLNLVSGTSFGAPGYAGQEHFGDFSYIGIGSLLKATYFLPFKYYLDLPYPTYLPLPILIIFWIGMAAGIIQVGIQLTKKRGKSIVAYRHIYWS